MSLVTSKSSSLVLVFDDELYSEILSSSTNSFSLASETLVFSGSPTGCTTSSFSNSMVIFSAVTEKSQLSYHSP